MSSYRFGNIYLTSRLPQAGHVRQHTSEAWLHGSVDNLAPKPRLLMFASVRYTAGRRDTHESQFVQHTQSATSALSMTSHISFKSTDEDRTV